MNYREFSRCVQGLKTPQLRKIIGVKTQSQFNREILKISSILNQFGLILRYISSEDKWYLLAYSNKPPSDLSKTLLATLSSIYKLSLNDFSITLEIIKEKRDLQKSTIIKHLKELECKKYIIIDSKNIKITTKTKKLLKLKR